MALEKLTSLALSMYSNKGAYAIFCGAGISTSAGIYTGWMIERDLIEKIAATKGVVDEPDWHAWYLKEYGIKASYSSLLNDVVKTPTERISLMKGYFEATDEEKEDGIKQPTKAHRAIAKLAKAGYVKLILSPNFDRLFESALQDEAVSFQVVYNVDDLDRITPIVHSGVTVVKFNGDYLDCEFRNTEDELDSYPEKLDNFLTSIFQDFGLITSGWSAQWDRGLVDIITKADATRYSSYFTYVGQPTTQLSSLSTLRNGELISIADADSFFTELSEQVFALEQMNTSKSLNKDVFIARIKKYLSARKYIELEELIEQEGYNANSLIQLDNYNFQVTPLTYNKYLELHIKAVDKLIAAAITILRWGKESDMKLFDDILVRFCTRKLRNGEVYIERTQYIQLFAPTLLLHAIGIASVKFGKYKYLKRLLELKVPSGNVLSYNSSVKLFDAVITQHWSNDEVNTFRGTNVYFPQSMMIMNNLKPYFQGLFITEDEYEFCFCVWENLASMIYGYHKIGVFNHLSERTYYPAGYFIQNRLRAMRVQDGFYNDYFAEAENLKDEWAPIKQGLFDGKYSEYLKCKEDADNYYKNNRTYI